MQEIAWQAMGLTQDPFPDHGPDDIFLQTPALGQRLSLFTQLTQASDLTLLLIGEHGIGKTTFLGRIAQLLEDGWHIANLRANPETTFDEIQEQLRDALASELVADEDAPTDDASLGGQLETLAANGYRALVVVDDAQLLGDEALVQLLELGQQVRLALAGDPSLAERITAVGESMTSSDAGLVHRIVLGELNSPQTTDYLRARLSRSGYTGTTPFTSEVCGQIYQRARGVPGIINTLASEFLESEPLAVDDDEAIELDPPTHDVATVKAKLTTHAPIQPRISLHTEPGRQGLRQTKPLIAIGVIVAALFTAGYGVYAWWNAEDPDATETSDSTNPAPESPVPESDVDSSLDERYPELPAAPPPPPPTVLADTAAPLVDALPPPTAEDTAAPAPVEDATGDVARAAVANLNLAPLNEMSPFDASADPGDAEVLPRPRRAPRQRRDEVAAVAATPAAVETRPAPAAITPSPASPGSTWLESGDKDRFTVQLIALGSASATREYIARHRLTDALIVSLKTPDAKPLFAVVQGVYDRRDRALDAIRRMPAPLRQEAPWPRHIGTLLEAAHNVRAR